MKKEKSGKSQKNPWNSTGIQEKSGKIQTKQLANKIN